MIRRYYDRGLRLWVSYELDKAENQIGVAGYGPNRKEADENRAYLNKLPHHQPDRCHSGLKIVGKT